MDERSTLFFPDATRCDCEALAAQGTTSSNQAVRNEAEDSNESLESRLRRSVSGPYNLILKPIIGLFIALPLIVALSPFLAVIALVIVADTGLPVFYRGERGGFRGKPFRIYKFRTMVHNADQIGGGTTALADPRITRVGKLLRKTKMDEFPQLLNVIRGEMCFVGPRPELLQYTRNYTGPETYITKVRPGITDFSSIEYINLDEVVGAVDADSAYERDILQHKNQLRVKYVEQMSPFTDLNLFVITVVRTVKGVLRLVSKGSRADGNH